jgi:hypothetical protein
MSQVLVIETTLRRLEILNQSLDIDYFPELYVYESDQKPEVYAVNRHGMQTFLAITSTDIVNLLLQYP